MLHKRTLFIAGPWSARLTTFSNGLAIAIDLLGSECGLAATMFSNARNMVVANGIP